MNFLKDVALIIISPTQLAFIFFLLSLALHCSKRKRASRFFSRLGVVWLLVFSQPFVADLLLYPLEHGESFNQQGKNNDEVVPRFVLPLACYFQTNTDIPVLSRWSECSLHRMLAAREYALQYEAQLIVTGGHFLRDKNVNYGAESTRFLKSLDLPDTSLITIGIGTNTREEMSSVTKLVSDAPILIISSATHTYRVEMLAKELGLSAQVKSAGFLTSGELTPYITLPSASALMKTKSAFYEYLAILKAYLER